MTPEELFEHELAILKGRKAKLLDSWERKLYGKRFTVIVYAVQGFTHPSIKRRTPTEVRYAISIGERILTSFHIPKE
jgi:hypothetical protein